MAGVKYEAHYSLTTVDPPELVRFIKEFYQDVIIDKPDETMWRLIERKRMPPTRIVRYCCLALKESKGKGRVTVTGVRWAESSNRKRNRNLVNIGTSKKRTVFNDENDESRRAVENCYRTRRTLVNPIIDWSDDDVWQFIREQNNRRRGKGMVAKADQAPEFERWPKYKQIYIHAFDRMIAKRIADGLPTEWRTRMIGG